MDRDHIVDAGPVAVGHEKKASTSSSPLASAGDQDDQIRPHRARAHGGAVRHHGAAIMNDRQTKEFDSPRSATAIAPPGRRFRVSLRAAGRRRLRHPPINARSHLELDLPPGRGRVGKRGLASWWAAPARGPAAAMVGYRNEKTRGHIVVVHQDPVAHPQCAITHRGGGRYRQLVERAQTPCARCAGRDPHRRDSRPRPWSTAFSETGHLGARHAARANSSTSAHNINFFPDERRDQLLIPVAQHPCPHPAAPDPARVGNGRIASMEITTSP
jgi:Tfp pilus assembly ATPase PilU